MTASQTTQFMREIEKINWPADVVGIIAPPNPYLLVAKQEKKNIRLAGQNCYCEPSGAYTGEVSVDMLKDSGCSFCIVGHSERREYFCETGDFLKKKVDAVLSASLMPIYCCGESKSERESQTHHEVIKKQLEESILHLSEDQMRNVIIAYEPVWAIGTGLTATAIEAQDMHAFIRKVLSDSFGSDLANSIPILYGGSCKPSNAGELFACPDVDGGLIGGASLEVESFVAIANSFPA